MGTSGALDRLNESRFSKDLLAAILGGLGYAVLATGTILLTANGRGVAAIWPANALLLAIVLPLPTRRWPVYFAAAFAANMISNMIGFRSAEASLLYATINVVEVAVAAALLRHKSL